MAITAEEARTLLGQTPQAATSTISPEEARSLLASGSQAVPPQGAMVDPTGGFLGQIRHPLDYLGGLTKGAAMAPVRAAQVGIGGGQELQRLLLNFPGAKSLLAKIASGVTGRQIPTAAVQPTPVISTKTPLGAIGKAVGDITAFGAPIGEAGMLGKTIARGGESLLAKALPALFQTGAGLATGGAFAPAGHRGMGALEMGAAALAPEAAGGVLKTLPKLDVVFRRNLGQRVIAGYNAVKEASKKLYDEAFEGTEGVTPELTDEAKANIKELKKRYPGERGAVPRAIKAYENVTDKAGKITKRNETLQNAHFLKSNLGDEWQKLEVKKKSPTATFTKEDEADQEAIQDTRNNLDKSLKNNFNKLSSDKKAQYDIAQTHFKNKVAPFQQKGHTAIMKAVSPDKEFTNKLFTELGADSVKATKVRNVMGLSRPQLEVARLIRNKYISIPAALGAIYGGRKLF